MVDLMSLDPSHAVEAVSIGRRVVTTLTCTSVLVAHTRGGLLRHAFVRSSSRGDDLQRRLPSRHSFCFSKI